MIYRLIGTYFPGYTSCFPTLIVSVVHHFYGNELSVHRTGIFEPVFFVSKIRGNLFECFECLLYGGWLHGHDEIRINLNMVYQQQSLKIRITLMLVLFNDLISFSVTFRKKDPSISKTAFLNFARK